MLYDLIIIGGGAAGVFAGINFKEKNRSASTLLLERSNRLLSKVQRSGGGRCNITNATFDPAILSKNYPRGEKELLGPFHVFQPKDTIAWFESRGVKLKVEDEGKVFPITNRSESVVNCLLEQLQKNEVEVRLNQPIDKIEKREDLFYVSSDEALYAKNLLLATGSSQSGCDFAKGLQHTIEEPIPSLFAFNVQSPLNDLSGVKVEEVELKLGNFSARGAILLTHFGFSGPAVLRLSSFAAKYLYRENYRAELTINWLPELSEIDIFNVLVEFKTKNANKTFLSPFNLPSNLWQSFLAFNRKRVVDISHKELMHLSQQLHKDKYFIEGRREAEEFVTCGGVTLKEVNFKTFESKICKHLYFAGEILDIDGLTGGFNLQNAWTTAFIAATSI